MPKSKLFLVPRNPPPNQVPNNLSHQHAPLIGREAETESVRRLLEQPDTRLVTLIGPGGIGKTRLALQIAEDLLDEENTPFTDGIYFIDLAPISDPEMLIPTIAAILQLRETPGAPLFSTLKDHLQTRSTLLVLDNLEQILPAAQSLADLITNCPNLKLLVTSRATLRLRAEREFPLAPLSLPDSKQNLNTTQVARFGAVALFVQRATAVEFDFKLTDENARSIVEVCRRVDGLPLAIELVAAYARLLSPQSMLARLTHPLRLLTGGVQDSAGRHQTMHDTIEWGYRLLSEKEQTLFRRLSVFVGGFTLQAAEAVCNDLGKIEIEVDDPLALDVLEGLDDLLEKSMIRRLEHTDDTDRRLGMLETVREYAREQLQASGEASTIQSQHANYYVHLAEHAQLSEDKEGEDLTAWLNSLNADLDNLRAALSWLVEHDGSSGKALSLLLHTNDFWVRRIQSIEYEKWLGRALTQPNLGNTVERIVGLRRASHMAIRQSNFPGARSWAEQSLAVASALGNNDEIAKTSNTLGAILTIEGDYAEARNVLTTALNIQRDRGDEAGVAQILISIGEVARFQGDYAGAEVVYKESLQLMHKLGEQTGIMYATMNLGHAIQHLGDLPQARKAFLESTALGIQLEFSSVVAESLTGLCGVILLEKASTQTAAAMQQIAHLSAFAAKIMEQNAGNLSTLDQAEFDHNIAAARSHLGNALFTAAWEEGQALTSEQALNLATKQHADRPQPSIPRGRGRPKARTADGLTEREYETVTLIAGGLTNNEIATRLTLSVRTVETHVANALQKLGLRTRTDLAAWAVRQNLPQQ